MFPFSFFISGLWFVHLFGRHYRVYAKKPHKAKILKVYSSRRKQRHSDRERNRASVSERPHGRDSESELPWFCNFHSDHRWYRSSRWSNCHGVSWRRRYNSKLIISNFYIFGIFLSSALLCRIAEVATYHCFPFHLFPSTNKSLFLSREPLISSPWFLDPSLFELSQCVLWSG